MDSFVEIPTTFGSGQTSSKEKKSNTAFLGSKSPREDVTDFSLIKSKSPVSEYIPPVTVKTMIESYHERKPYSVNYNKFSDGVSTRGIVDATSSTADSKMYWENSYGNTIGSTQILSTNTYKDEVYSLVSFTNDISFGKIEVDTKGSTLALIKLDSEGKEKWLIRILSFHAEHDGARYADLKIDNQGNFLIVIGLASDVSFFNEETLKIGRKTDLLLKIDPTGDMIFKVAVEGSRGGSIIDFYEDDIYMVGSFSGTLSVVSHKSADEIPITPGLNTTIPSDSVNFFVIKIYSNGSTDWIKVPNSGNLNQINGISVFKNRIVVGGSFVNELNLGGMNLSSSDLYTGWFGILTSKGKWSHVHYLKNEKPGMESCHSQIGKMGCDSSGNTYIIGDLKGKFTFEKTVLDLQLGKTRSIGSSVEDGKNTVWNFVTKLSNFNKFDWVSTMTSTKFGSMIARAHIDTDSVGDSIFSVFSSGNVAAVHHTDYGHDEVHEVSPSGDLISAKIDNEGQWKWIHGISGAKHHPGRRSVISDTGKVFVGFSQKDDENKVNAHIGRLHVN